MATEDTYVTGPRHGYVSTPGGETEQLITNLGLQERKYEAMECGGVPQIVSTPVSHPHVKQELNETMKQLADAQTELHAMRDLLRAEYQEVGRLRYEKSQEPTMNQTRDRTVYPNKYEGEIDFGDYLKQFEALASIMAGRMTTGEQCSCHV